MKRWQGMAAAAALATGLSACEVNIGPGFGTLHGSGRIVSESRGVYGYHAIELSGAGFLFIEQAGYESLRIEADDNIMPFVRSDVLGGHLVLGPARNGGVSPSRTIDYYLTVRDLDEIVVSGASHVVVDWLDTRRLVVSLSGASVVEIAGIVDRQDLGLSGASRYLALDFESLVTEIGASGASAALVNVLDLLRADLSGASSVEFVGRPNRVTQTVSGGSWVAPY